MANIPSELLILISQHFTRAFDFVSFGMMNKRLFDLTLRHIADHKHKQSKVLNSFLRARIVYHNGSDELSQNIVNYNDYRSVDRWEVIYELPNGWKHGEYQQYQALMEGEVLAEDSATCSLSSLIQAPGIANKEAMKEMERWQAKRKLFMEKESSWNLNKQQGESKVWCYCEEKGAIYMERLSMWEDGLLQGVETVYYPMGQICEVACYHQGKKHGTRVRYFADGLVDAREDWKNGKEDGAHESYSHAFGDDPDNDYGIEPIPKESNPTFLLNRHTNKEGVKQGQSEEWHPNGVLAVVVHFVDGKRDGLMTCWTEDGLLEEQASWKQGRMHGIAVFYSETGTISQKILYQNSRWLEKEEYDSQGCLKSTKRRDECGE